MLLLKQVAQISRFRDFIAGSVKREFALRYRNSMLGAAWLILQPLAQILIFTVVFARVMQARLPNVTGTFSYSIFLCAGVLTWGFFTEIVSRSQNVFLERADLIKKLNFPRVCLPVIVILNAALGFAIIFGIFTAFLLITGEFPGWAYLALFPVLAIHMLFAIGLGMILAVLNVFFRDVGKLFDIITQFWFWMTPIVYPISALPEWALPIMKFNPMVPLVVTYQGILVRGEMPDWAGLLPVTLLALLLCAVGLRLYIRRSGEMVDEL